jgi:hypothetical protein
LGEADGDASVEADVDVFFAVEVFFVVDAAWVVVPVDVAVVSSFFWVWQPKKAASVSAVIKDKTDVFIGLVKLNEDQECRSSPARASIKNLSFFLPNFHFLLCHPPMSTRILLAGILGGAVMFIWSFVAHDVLPLGEMGVREIPNEDAVTSVIQTNLGDTGDKIGFYIFPSGGLTPGATSDQKKAAMQKAEEQMATGAAGVLIYHPKRVFNFPKRLGIEFATEVFEALLAVFLLAQTGISGFGGKVGFILTAGVLAAVATNVPYWNWYGFPRTYVTGYMLTQLIGFLLVGIVAGLLLKPKSPAAA